jgi:hypothetical protein
MNKPKQSGLAKLQKVLNGIFFFGILNFFIFVAGTSFLGGDAVNGKEMDGKYFVGSHGKLTEVSKPAFRYSRLHVLSLLITHPAAILAGLASYILKKRSENQPPSHV